MNEVDYLILYFVYKDVKDLVVQDQLYVHDEDILDRFVVFYIYLEEKKHYHCFWVFDQ